MLIDLISSNASSTTSTTSTVAWVGAIASFVGGTAGAVLGGIIRLRADKTARKSESQRVALHALQDAVLDIRQILIEIGDDVMTAKQTKAYDRAIGTLEFRADNVACEVVRERCDEWLGDAVLFFTGADEGSPHKEELQRDRLRNAIRKELRRFDA